jgi:serine/threonine protein kinase
MIGSVLGGYQIISRIKDGSVGTVWKGRNPFNEDVAIKVLSPRNVENARKRREFRNEASIARSLHHASIIKVHNYTNAKPQPFYVMEYFDSENLKYAMFNLSEWIKGREFQILLHLCDAIHYMHQMGIVHLDIKPENILINSASEIRLIDFSIARTSWGRLFHFGRTKWGGTPGYMAPEQISGSRVSPATDQYAFGVLTYEMITRRAPFAATHCTALLDKHLNEPPPSLRSHLRMIPQDLDKVVLRMLEKSPRARWPDMAAVTYELDRMAEKYGTWYLEATTGTVGRTTVRAALGEEGNASLPSNQAERGTAREAEPQGVASAETDTLQRRAPLTEPRPTGSDGTLLNDPSSEGRAKNASSVNPSSLNEQNTEMEQRLKEERRRMQKGESREAGAPPRAAPPPSDGNSPSR